MKIRIIALGKIKEKFLKLEIDEFIKRILSYAPIEVIEFVPVEIKDENLIERALNEEGEKILSYIKPQSYVITMEINGRQFSSEEFSQKLTELINYGMNDIVFIIGSSYGISKKVSERADLKMSISKMTFLHRFVRLLLIEQIYRAFKIMRHETYHK